MGDPVLPQQLGIRVSRKDAVSLVVDAWKATPSHMQETGEPGRFASRVQFSQHERPWICLDLGHWFPLPSHPADSHSRIPWSLANLRTIVLGHLTRTVPPYFWEELGRLPRLEGVCFKWARFMVVEPFLEALVYGPGRYTGEEGADPDLEDGGSWASFAARDNYEIDDTGSRATPRLYPALRALVFGSLGTNAGFTKLDMKRLRFPFTQEMNGMESAELYLRHVAKMLSNWSDSGLVRQLDEVIFWEEEHPPHRPIPSVLRPDNLDKEALVILSHVSRGLRWEDWCFSSESANFGGPGSGYTLTT